MADGRSVEAENSRQIDVSDIELEILKFVLLREYEPDQLPTIRIGVHFKGIKCPPLTDSLRNKGLIENIFTADFYQITAKGLEYLVSTKTITLDELLFNSNDKVRQLVKEYYDSL